MFRKSLRKIFEDQKLNFEEKSFKNTNLKSILSSLMINALIPTFIIRNIINLMLKKKWGRIVNCTTIGIKFGGGEFSYNYNLAKHCLEFIPNKFKFWAKNNVHLGILAKMCHFVCL